MSRVCTHEGCGTILSRFNPDSTCAIHTLPALELMRVVENGHLAITYERECDKIKAAKADRMIVTPLEKWRPIDPEDIRSAIGGKA